MSEAQLIFSASMLLVSLIGVYMIIVSLIIILIMLSDFNYIYYYGCFLVMKNEHVEVLTDYIKDTVAPSFTNVRVVSYIFVSVLLVGGAGIWMPWAKEAHLSSWLPGSTVFTYCFALLGSLICNRLYFYTKSLKEIKGNYETGMEQPELEKYFDKHEKDSVISAWGMLFGSFIIILVTFSYSKYYNEDSFVGWLGLALSILLYFSASAEELDKISRVQDKKDNQEAEPIVPSSMDGPVTEGSAFFSEGESE
jgi:hypothetical protein